MLTYKFRIYPSEHQKLIFAETLETCRRLYNRLLADRITNHTGVFEQNHMVSQLRKRDKYLKQVHSQVVQDVAFRLDKAFGSHFAGISRHPRFKRKGTYRSFTYPQFGKHGGSSFREGNLRMSMIGGVRINIHREILGTPKTCTVFRDVDQWYACLCVKEEANGVSSSPRPPVGVDLGLTKSIALSDGRMIPSPKYFKQSEAELRTLQRNLSRKKLGSKNWETAKLRLAKGWRKVRRRRTDFAHKTSHLLAHTYGTIMFENLVVEGIIMHNRLASAILDACWGELRRLTAYKAERCGGRVVLVDPRGTSQECSGCGRIVEKDLSVRVHSCPGCGLEIDRDVNAARNILARGLEQARVEVEPLPVTRIGKFSRGSNKPAAQSCK